MLPAMHVTDNMTLNGTYQFFCMFGRNARLLRHADTDTAGKASKPGKKQYISIRQPHWPSASELLGTKWLHLQHLMQPRLDLGETDRSLERPAQQILDRHLIRGYRCRCRCGRRLWGFVCRRCDPGS